MIKVTEEQIMAQIQEFLTGCDADDLARLTGELFGGECYAIGLMDNEVMTYEFEPDENYMGAFGEVEENS